MTNCKEYTSDSDYVRDIRLGGAVADHAADCLYRRYRNDVLNSTRTYLRFRSGIEDDALDMVQDAFLVLREKIQDGGYNEGSLVHFWIGITKGLLRNKLKRDSRTDLIENTSDYDTADFDSPEYQMLSSERAEILDKVLSRLGDRCKKILMLWAGGYSMDEIATKLDLSSEAMARKTKYKCKNQLMELIDDIDLDL